ncbi:uncharacterized protein LOC141646512 [Silene latifolia]|uniref:uncharacterized protein LOC141646512 n=1 Tax=Silene latifolia TaxID=37657 RepID=UPI003D78A4C4
MTPHSPDLLSTIEFVKDGWLLLRIEGHSLQCFNPFKGKSYKYPSNVRAVRLTSLAFSTCPTFPDCLTVGIWAYNYSVHISYHRARNHQWEYCNIECDSQTGIRFSSNSNSSPKYHDGSFYFLDTNGNLGVLKMVDEEWIWKVHKGPVLEDISLYSCQLAELGGQLISVFIKENGIRIQVFKFDTLGNHWVAIDDLGDYMLFLSPASSFSVSTKDNSMRNRIYLQKRIGNEMVFYSLNDGMYHTSSSQRPSKDFYGMRSQSFCCWL